MKLLFVLLAASAAFASQNSTVHIVTLLDFQEDRHGGPGVPEMLIGMGSCVNRDYTLDMPERIVTLRQHTCNPRINPAVVNEVGSTVQVITRAGESRMGLVNDHGKAIWLPIFRTARKAK